ncbi:MAG: GYD domain-containing protein [Acetobacteraceae bacterium]|nr:GYD domain-containing protein [Acetobacteraceae bacterium]
MPVFMYELAYTAESLAAQMKAPADRIETVAKPAAEAAGGKLVGGWYSFGDFDLVLILDMPDVESMAGVAIAVGAGGAVRAGRTTPLMTGQQAVAGFRKASAVAATYRPAR